MGFLDFLKTVAKGLTTAAGNIVPIVGPAAAAELNKQYRKGGMVMRKGGMVPAMAGGGLFGDMTSNIIAPMRTNPMTGKWEVDQDKMDNAKRLGIVYAKGGIVSTPMGKMMVAPKGAPKKKRVQKKKK